MPARPGHYTMSHKVIVPPPRHKREHPDEHPLPSYRPLRRIADTVTLPPPHPGFTPAPPRAARASRPGQAVPRGARSRHSGGSACDGCDDHDDLPAQQQADPRNRQVRLEEAWAERRPGDVGEVIAYAAANGQARQERCDMLVQQQQRRTEAACECFQQKHACGSGQQFHMERRPMPLVGLTFRGILQLPTIVCSACSASFEPSPIQVGCWSSSPVDGRRWYDLEVLEAFRDLTLRDGLSGTGKRHAAHARP